MLELNAYIERGRSEDTTAPPPSQNVVIAKIKMKTIVQL